MKLKVALLSVALCAVQTLATAADAYFRFPTVRGNTVVFTAEGDLWKVALEGGQAQRLTTHPSAETHAAISPDGQTLAFSAFYEGTQEAYVMPMAGGLPRRISFENGAVKVLGWTAHGEVLVAMQNATGPGAHPVVAAIHSQTLDKQVFPVADANDATLDDTGRYLYFTRLGLQLSGDNARRYRGGLKAQLWRFDLQGKDEAVVFLADANANFKRPMWFKGRLYFISDKNGADNLWSAQPDGKALQPLTRHSDWDVRNASMGDGNIAYQLGADLHVLDLNRAADKRLPISLVSDFDQQRVRQIKSPLDMLTSVEVANKEERIVLTARGRVSLPSLGGKRRMDIAIPLDARARAAVFSPDDQWVYAIVDTTGENEIWRFSRDGSSPAKALTHNASAHRWALFPSPDGKWLAHTDKRGRLWLLDLATLQESVIDDALVDGFEEHEAVVWAPDSKSLALVRNATDSVRKQIAIYPLEGKKVVFVTSDRYNSYSPSFSPDGRWLYFLSDRNFELGNRAPWGDRNMGPVFDRRTGIFALALQAGNRFPFKPDDELSIATNAPAQGKEAKDAKPKLPAIAMEGLAQRLFEVPLPAGNYRDLATDGKRLYYVERDPLVADKGLIKTLAIDKNGPKPETFAGTEVRNFALAGDGKRIFYRTFVLPAAGPGDFYLVEAAAKQAADVSKQKFKLDDWSITLDPRAQWRQMVQDAWRLQRDFLFDKTMRGVDWPAMRAKYFPLVERVTDREELNDVLAMMMGELGALHSQIAPGDIRRATSEGAPTNLGAVLERVPGGYRIDRIFQGAQELPSERGPLAQPDLDVRTGDIITAVNGKPVVDARDISDMLLNQAGQQVKLELQRAGKALPAVIVKPVTQARHNSLRYSDWEEGRSSRVHTASQGRMGYLHLRAMTAGDMATFAREFYSNISKEGLIIDVRRNNGGNIDSWVMEKLLRKAWAFWTNASGIPEEGNMQQTFRGHLVVLVDELTYSDGETFAAGVKALGLAPLVGKRTAGAGAWLSPNTRLSDNGMARAAESAQFLASSGDWIIEGVGVTPDVDVDNPPHATFLGEDRQLDAAIGLLKKKLAENPVKKRVPGAIPPLPAMAK